MLRDRILSRRYEVGAMLPSEDDLARMFNVSRTTIRNALAALHVGGLIEKRQGIGTFVRESGTATPIRTSMSDMVTHIHEIGRSTTVQVIEFGFEKPPKHVQELFDAEDDAIFQRAIRVRRLKKRPILYVTSYIPETIGRQFGAADMEKRPIFDLLEDAGIRLKAGEQWVSATLAEPIVASRLAIEVGSPLLQIERIHFNEKKRRSSISKSWPCRAFSNCACGSGKGKTGFSPDEIRATHAPRHSAASRAEQYSSVFV